MRRLLFIGLLLQLSFVTKANVLLDDTLLLEEVLIEDASEESPPHKYGKLCRIFHSNKSENNRFTAAALTIALGPFGAHRLYLGTDYKVPLVYSLTFGCFFILPTVDFFVIIFTKDFERLQNNPKVIMWVK